jgi:glycosyltransferase involved in cell wall biosynthesis
MHWGGQEFRTLLEHNYLNNHQHESYLMCHPESKLYLKAVDSGAKNIIAINLSRTWRLDVAWRIASFCRSQKIDIINSHSGKDSALCLPAYLLATPLIRSRQITSPIKKNWSYKRGCSHVLAAADAIKSILISTGVDPQKITVVGEGIDLEEFHANVDSAYLKKEFDIQPADKVISNIGMMRADKGQKYFLEAAIKIAKLRSDIKFFLIGGTTSQASRQFELELAELIKQHHLEKNIIMTGYRNDIAEFIHLSDFVVVASTGTEAQSRIVPQTFATHRTVVSTNVGGLTELVLNEVNGLVVPPADSTAISNAMLKLLDDTMLKNKLESAAYVMAKEQLSFEMMMMKTINLYTDIASEKKIQKASI